MEMKAWLQRFMYGRYGQDDLSRFLSLVALTLCIVSIIAQWPVLNSLGLALLVFCIFRMFSRNTEKRGQENLAFLRIKEQITGFFSRTIARLRQGRTHWFYQCPSCKQQLRVPKGKGSIRIHCSKCGTSFEKKS